MASEPSPARARSGASLRIGGLTLRAAFAVGAALTAGVWLFAGFYFSHRIVEMGTNEASATSGRYTRSQELLNTARDHLYRASDIIRDALLDPAGDPLVYRDELEQTYQSADDAIAQYSPDLDSGSQLDTVQSLRHDISALRETAQEAFSADVPGWRDLAGEVLRTRIVPRRDRIMRLVQELQVLNREDFIQHQADIGTTYQTFQRRLWQSLGLALAGSFAIGLVATIYASRLERRIDQQRSREMQTARDLQRLSSKLVTVQEEERRIIARELHDEVGQLLTAVKVELSRARLQLTDEAPATEAVDGAREIADRALHSVRDLSHLLHPAILDDLGLPEAIDWYAQGLRNRHQLAVDVDHGTMHDRLAGDIEVAIYRIVQEATTNVVKHARAASCRIRLERTPGSVRVAIDDDGVGFDSGLQESEPGLPGIGLIGIRERVASLGGRLEIQTAPGRGTTLVVNLPVPETMPLASVSEAS